MQGHRLREYRSLEEILAAAARSEFDVFLALATTERREAVMDFSHPFLRSGAAIAVASESTGPRWISVARNLVSRDLLKVAGLLTLLWLVAGGLVWSFERRRNRDMFGGGAAHGIGQGIWWAAVTMTTVGYGDKAPRTPGGRLVAIVWMLSSIVLISSFTAAVTTSLTVRELRGTVRGLNDLHDVRVGTVDGSEPAEFLGEHGIAAQTFVSEREGLRAVADGTIDAFVYDGLVLRHLVNTEFAEPLRVLATTYDHYYISMGLPTDSPLREPINRALLEIMDEDNWLGSWERDPGYDR